MADRPALFYNGVDMIRPPLILVSPNIEKKGDEFGDMSTSLSETYQKALKADKGLSTIPDVEIQFAIGDVYEMMNDFDDR